VIDRLRHKRLRLLLKDLNKQRKKQAKQIDILCNDFLTAQKDFIGRLNVIHFAADFYESILGMTDLGSIFNATVAIIKDEIDDSNVTFFLRQDDNFELHIFEASKSTDLEVQNLENSFSPELMDNICQANKICTLDDMLAMGLQVNPMGLSTLSAITFPLGSLATSLGFILVYRSSEKKLTPKDLWNLCSIRTGLSRAISSCQQPTHLLE